METTVYQSNIRKKYKLLSKRPWTCILITYFNWNYYFENILHFLMLLVCCRVLVTCIFQADNLYFRLTVGMRDYKIFERRIVTHLKRHFMSRDASRKFYSLFQTAKLHWFVLDRRSIYKLCNKIIVRSRQLEKFKNIYHSQTHISYF